MLLKQICINYFIRWCKEVDFNILAGIVLQFAFLFYSFFFSREFCLLLRVGLGNWKIEIGSIHDLLNCSIEHAFLAFSFWKQKTTFESCYQIATKLWFFSPEKFAWYDCALLMEALYLVCDSYGLLIYLLLRWVWLIIMTRKIMVGNLNLLISWSMGTCSYVTWNSFFMQRAFHDENKKSLLCMMTGSVQWMVLNLGRQVNVFFFPHWAWHIKWFIKIKKFSVAYCCDITPLLLIIFIIINNQIAIFLQKPH